MDSHRHEHRGYHSASATVGATTVYTCPMHPEVRQGQPGNCPKCGMHLVLEGAAEADGGPGHQAQHSPLAGLGGAVHPHGHALFGQLGLQTEEVYGFGTAAVDAHALARTFNVIDPSFVKWFFGTLKQWKDIVSFDAWVANEDRHCNNLLVDKTATLWLIDHDLAFGGRRAVSSLRPDEVTPNRLVNDFGPLVGVQQRHEAVDSCHRFQANAEAVDVAGAASSSAAGLFISEQELQQLILYVEKRRALVPAILAQSLGVPLLPGAAA